MFPTELIPYVQDYFPTGSRVICNPPVMDTDEDWAVLEVRHWSPTRKSLADVLKEGGWDNGGSGATGSFQSWKKDDLNLIIFHSPSAFAKYRLVTRIATVLNLQKKEDRINLFSMVQDDASISDPF